MPPINNITDPGRANDFLKPERVAIPAKAITIKLIIVGIDGRPGITVLTAPAFS